MSTIRNPSRLNIYSFNHYLLEAPHAEKQRCSHCLQHHHNSKVYLPRILYHPELPPEVIYVQEMRYKFSQLGSNFIEKEPCHCQLKLGYNGWLGPIGCSIVVQ